MKKILAVTMLLMFGFVQGAFASGVVLSNKDMDSISAGDWVVLTDANGNQTVTDVYYNNNDIQLLNESQTELKAVNNANAVDSAIAVQTNIARVSSTNGPTNNVAVNGTNTADVTNMNPSDYSKSTSKHVVQENDVEHTLATSAADTTDTSSETASSSSSSSSSCSLNINYNDNEALAGTDQSVGKGEISQGSLSGTKVETLVVVASKSSSAAAAASSGKQSASSSKSVTAQETSIDKSKTETTESSNETRSNKSENNHLTLLNTSQKTLKAVSNLNAVGSGAAVQTNIASNVGVSGTITHINSAKVVNGL